MNSAEPRASFVAQYLVTADADASVMPRMLEFFARRGLVPGRFEAARSGETLTLRVWTSGLEPDAAAHVRNCMAVMVNVRSARLFSSAAHAAAV
jgi:hypothetical protein